MNDVHVPPRSTALMVVESVASIALVIFAIIGNFLILVALYRNPHLRNSTNIYIAALAVTDLLNACIPGTLFVSTMVMGRLMFSLSACRLSGFLVHFLTYVSMATMTLTAVNRYFRVVKPQHFKKLFSHRRSLLLLGVLWLLIALLCLSPKVVGVGEFNFIPPMSICAYTFSSEGAKTAFTLIVVLILVMFCLSLICFCYYHVSKTIREHNAGILTSLSDVSVQEINLSKVLFILVFAFALCWLPTFAVIFIIRLILKRAPHALAVVSPFLFQVSSAVNPFIYGALSPPFQREFRRLLMFQRRRSTSDETPRNASGGKVVGEVLMTSFSLRHAFLPHKDCVTSQKNVCVGSYSKADDVGNPEGAVLRYI